MSGPGTHHDPPADLAALSLPLTQVPQAWVRVHPKEFGAIFFGRTGRYRFDAPSQPDGLLFRARHDPDRVCAALFDRVSGVLSEERMGSLWDPPHRRLLGRLLDHYDFGLL